ncbi:hypothetical protein ACO0QE_000974 [Hanseniaspora vineae]
MNHQSELDVFLIKAYKVLTLQRRGITDDQESGSLISQGSGSTNANGFMSNPNNSSALGANSDNLSRSDDPYGTTSSVQTGQPFTSTNNPSTSVTFSGNTNDKVVIVDINDFVSSAGSSPYHQMGLTNSKDNELFTKIAKLYNVIFLSESGANASFFDLNFENEQMGSGNKENANVGVSGSNNDFINGQPRKNTKKSKISGSASGSPKSAIELYQKFYQIVRELDLNYEGCPYSKYFIKLSDNLLQIKSDNELIMDPVWKSMTYKFFGKYKYIKLITQLTSSKDGSSKQGASKKPFNNNKNNNNNTNAENSPAPNLPRAYSSAGTYQFTNKYDKASSSSASPAETAPTKDASKIVGNGSNMNMSSSLPGPNTMVSSGLDVQVAQPSNGVYDIGLLGTKINENVANNDTNTNGPYVLNREVKQRVKKLQKERKSTKKGYFTTPTSPTTSWMNNFLNTAGTSDLNDGFNAESSNDYPQLTDVPNAAPTTGGMSNNLLDPNTMADFENSLLNLQASSSTDLAKLTESNEVGTTITTTENPVFNANQGAPVYPVDNAKIPNLSVNNMSSTLFGSNTTAGTPASGPMQDSLNNTRNNVNNAGRARQRKAMKNRRYTGSSYYSNVSNLPKSDGINRAGLLGLHRKKDKRSNTSTEFMSNHINIKNKRPNIGQGLNYGSYSYAPSIGDDDDDDDDDDDGDDHDEEDRRKKNEENNIASLLEQQKRQQMIINAATNALNSALSKQGTNVAAEMLTKRNIKGNNTTNNGGGKFIDGVDVDMQELLSFSNKLSPSVAKVEGQANSFLNTDQTFVQSNKNKLNNSPVQAKNFVDAYSTQMNTGSTMTEESFMNRGFDNGLSTSLFGQPTNNSANNNAANNNSANNNNNNNNNNNIPNSTKNGVELPMISESTLGPPDLNNLDVNVGFNGVNGAHPLSIKHNTSVDGGSDAGSARGQSAHSRSQSRRKNMLFPQAAGFGSGMLDKTGVHSAPSNIANMNMQAGAPAGMQPGINGIPQSNQRVKNGSGSRFDSGGGVNGNNYFSKGGPHPGLDGTKNPSSSNRNNSSGVDSKAQAGIGSINTLDIYDRLMKEKDLRIQQLEQEIELQRQETLWLRKMLMEDMGVVRSMLKDIKK